jgi:3-oxoacyl-[acyl-carrier-protein] synthase II
MVAANDTKVREGGASRGMIHSASQAGAQATTAATILYLQSNLPPHQAGHIGRTVSCACTSGLDAVGEAWRLIRDREADLVITGGVDAPLVPYPLAAYHQGGLMSNHHHPETASRPFDCFADTGIVSEGAACLVLESLEHARWRQAPIHLEICSYGSRFDLPNIPGSGYLPSMESALEQTRHLKQRLGHISAWAPGLPLLDEAEAHAIARLIDKCGYRRDTIPTYSIKGTTGNPFAAAGAMQIAVECAAARHNLLPPTANLEYPLTDKIDLIMKEARTGYQHLGLINSHGVGGGNSSLVVRAFPG